MWQPSAACIKFLVTKSGSTVVARVLTGPSYEEMTYSGTITTNAVFFDHLVDALIYAASDQRFSAGFQVYFAPDDDMRVG